MAAPETALATAAAHRHGIVTRAQLRCLGMLDGAIERRVDAGLLVPLHQGVYRHAAAPATTEATDWWPPPVVQHDITLPGGGRARLDLAWPELRVPSRPTAGAGTRPGATSSAT